MKKRVGVTIGKFMPLHKGHELLIRMGYDLTDDFHVIVSGQETDEIPLSTRVDWVSDFCLSEGLSEATIHYHQDNSPTPVNIDESGTVLDEEFQTYWEQEFRRLVPDVTHMVTSDLYGQVLAKRMGLEWIPVDPSREIVPISATRIRNDLISSFRFISDVARPYFIKRIAIVGPESTGKSTLTKYMASITNSAYALEYGRTISEAKGNILDKDDFYNIVEGQETLIDRAIESTNSPCIFVDSEAFVTHLFYLDFFNEEPPGNYILSTAYSQNFDLYVVMSPEVDWIDDGTRIMGDQNKRVKFTNDLITLLDKYKKSYTVITGDDFEMRKRKASFEIMRFLFGKD